MSAVLLARESAAVTDWPQRVALTAATLAAALAVLALMLRGWRRRAGRQGDMAAPPVAPPDPGPELARADGTYVGTTTAGDWLDRIVVHGLGVRSAAVMVVAPGGVLLERQGAPDVYVPAALVSDVRLARGMAGKIARQDDGLVVLTWTLGRRSVDTGFLPRRLDDRDVLLAALRHLETAAGDAR